MGSGGTCHECGKRDCECDFDPVADERAQFLRLILQACRNSGVTIDFDFMRAMECGIEEPSFGSEPLDEAGHGFVVDLSEIADRLRSISDNEHTC
jgi:hypothetical protein